MKKLASMSLVTAIECSYMTLLSIENRSKTHHTVLLEITDELIDEIQIEGSPFEKNNVVIFMENERPHYNFAVKVIEAKIIRLNELTDQDAINEGVEKIAPEMWRDYSLPLSDPETKTFTRNPAIRTPLMSFITWWNSTYDEKYHWSKNPFVVSFTFKLVQDEKDEVIVY